MKNYNFWQGWLFIVSLMIVIFGIFMAFFNQTLFFDVFNKQIDPVFWGDHNPPEASSHFQRWLYGVWGATVAGWWLMVTFIVHYPFQKREKWAWTAIFTSLVFWYVLDTGISVFFGVNFNAIFNTLLIILFTPPLIATRKHLRR